MSFMEAVRSCFSRYVDFQGRSRRSEFWFFALFLALVGVVFQILFTILGASMFSIDPATGQLAFGGGAGAVVGLAIVYVIFILGTFLPNLAVAIRRLHDTGRSGWWILIGLVPLVGLIVLIVFCVQDSEPGTNAWGPNPKLGAGAAMA